MIRVKDMNGIQTGWTLIETLVVMAIMGVLLVIAYPYIMEMLYAAESKRVENLFVQALREARANSYITKKDVVICTLNSTGGCDRAADSLLTLFEDVNGNNRKDTTDRVIYQSDWQIKYGSILLRTSLSRDYIRYMGDTAKPRGHIGHLRYCSVSGNKRLSFKVIVNMYGNVRVERGDLVEVGC